MISIESFGRWPAVAWIGSALLHFLWQGAALAIVLAILLHLLRRSSAAARYCAACGTLLLMTLCPPATTLVIARSNQIAEPLSTAVSPPIPHDLNGPRNSMTLPSNPRPSTSPSAETVLHKSPAAF